MKFLASPRVAVLRGCEETRLQDRQIRGSNPARGTFIYMWHGGRNAQERVRVSAELMLRESCGVTGSDLKLIGSHLRASSVLVGTALQHNLDADQSSVELLSS